MKHLLTLALPLLVAIGTPVASAGQESDPSSVVGTWESTMETPRGSVTQEYVFTMTEGALAGTVQGRRGSTELEDITYENGTLSFSIVRNFNGNTLTQTITATVSGDSMSGTMSGRRGGSREFTATRKDDG